MQPVLTQQAVSSQSLPGCAYSAAEARSPSGILELKGPPDVSLDVHSGKGLLHFLSSDGRHDFQGTCSWPLETYLLPQVLGRPLHRVPLSHPGSGTPLTPSLPLQEWPR